jgi:hypothetical protein
MRYADDWREHQRLWKRFLLWWVGGVVINFITLVALSVLLGLFLPPEERDVVLNLLFLVLGTLWVLGTLGQGMKLFAGFNCPRCGKPFYMKSLRGNPWTWRCLHCGLRKGALES